MNATQATKIVRAFVVDPTGATVCANTECAPSSLSPKAYDRNAKIAAIKALCAARLAAFESSL